MDINPLIRKCLAIAIILLFVGAGIVPSTAKPLRETANTVPHPGNIFGLNSNILISWDANETKEPLIPQGCACKVILNVSFWVTWGIFGRLINYLYKYEPLIMKLSVVDFPEWCNAFTPAETFYVNIPRNENTYYEIHTYLTVRVHQINAPAFEVFPVTMQATIEPLYGPFGFFQVMQGTTQVVNVTFTVAYLPMFNIQLPEGNVIETPPLIQVELPMRITNLGNGKTIVENEVVNHSSDWTVSIPAQVILDVDEYKDINLTIIAPSNFSGEKTITVSFTPHSFDNYSLVGQTKYVTILAYYHPS